MKSLWPRHFNRLFLCPLCSQSLTDKLPICRYCYVDLPRLHLHDCQGNLLNVSRYRRSLEHQHWDKLICATEYKWPANHLVTELKYSGQSKLADFMAAMLSKQISKLNNLPEAIIPVPMHKERLRARGYNQSELMGTWLADKFSIPMLASLIEKPDKSVPQSELTGKLRRKNLKDAFSYNLSFDTEIPEHIAIIDDVITTGSTVNDVARILKKCGVKQVDVWGFALTEPT